MVQYRCLYSIGFRCGTEMILKRLNMIKFSSVFGSCCVATIEKVIACLDTKFRLLFNPNYLFFSKDISEFQHLNSKYGNRTLNIVFDDLTDWHGATIAHHDLSDEKNKNHFERAITRLYKLFSNNIPTLFIYTGPPVPFLKCQELVSKIQHEYMTDFHILFCFLIENSPVIKVYNDNFISIYKTMHEEHLDEILKNFDIGNLITIEELDSKRLFVI